MGGPSRAPSEPMNISVIIPTYNRAQPLARALDSVLAQSYPATEVIVVDDGSTDGTDALVQTQFPEVVFLRQANAGVSAARNVGIQHARGEWIALLDSDDLWHPNKLAAQRQVLLADPASRICHSDEIWIRNGVRVNAMHKHQKKGGWIFRDCLPLCAISPSAVMIHRDLFAEVGLFDESLPACEDYDLWLRLCSRYPVSYIDEALVTKHGGHDDQLSRKHWGMDRFRIQALDNILKTAALETHDREAATNMLRDKLGILIAGAIKHDNQALRRRCEQRLAALSIEVAV